MTRSESRIMRDDDEWAGRWRIGERIDNRYEIMGIKHGGMGLIYFCYDKQYKEPVAIKTIKDDLLKKFTPAERSELMRHFKLEAEAWVRLEKHPNIVQSWYVMEIEKKPYIFLQYIAGDEQYGVDLSGWIRRGGLQIKGKPNIPLALNFALQFCHGMMYAESKFKQMGRPFVHRDIKPSNILITRGKTAKITDFGLVKSMSELGKGSVVGTPAYMSPEQWINSDEIDTRSDIYSFGCVLYEMVTGRPPFLAVNSQGYRDSHINVIPESPDIDEDIQMMIMKCLEKDRDKRYQDFNKAETILSKLYYRLTEEVITAPEGETLKAWELSNKGSSLGELGHHEEAIDCLLGSIKINPNSYETRNNLGVIYKQQGKPEEAIKEYIEALGINSEYAEAHFNLAVVWEDRGEIDKAIEEYKEALRINHGLATAHCNLGILYKQQGKLEEATKELKEAISIDPNFIEAHNNLGIIYKLQNKLIEATVALKEAIRINPNYAEAHNNLGVVYANQGNIDQAGEEYRKAICINPNYADAHNNLGDFYKQQGKLVEAIEEYREALRINPNDAEAHCNLGVTLIELSRKKKGNEQDFLLDEALKSLLASESAETGSASYNLACVYAIKGNETQALLFLETALKERPTPTRLDILNDIDLENLKKFYRLKELLDKYRPA